MKKGLELGQSAPNRGLDENQVETPDKFFVKKCTIKCIA